MTNSISTASVSWTDSNGVHLRVYSSDGYAVTERCYDSGAWTDGMFSQSGTEVSATSWQDNGIYIRVYCSYQDNTVEWCWDAGASSWYQGAYTGS